MKKQTNRLKRLLLFSIFTSIVLCGASFSASAQDWGATGYNSYVARAIRQQSMDRAIRRQASRGSRSRHGAARRSARRHRRH